VLGRSVAPGMVMGGEEVGGGFERGVGMGVFWACVVRRRFEGVG